MEKPKILTQSPMSTSTQRELEEKRIEYFENGIGSVSDKLNSASRFLSRQNFAKYICYYELFKETENVLGSIVECGVTFGRGLMAYANIAAALEPYNYQCKIIGFDTFLGDIGTTEVDVKNAYFKREEGDYFADSYEDLQKAIEIYDADRPLNHFNKVELIKGDLRITAKQYVEKNPALTIRLLNLSVNLYEPTKEALAALLPRVAKGGIVVIWGINNTGTGATKALIETVGELRNIELKTFDFYPAITYFKVQ